MGASPSRDASPDRHLQLQSCDADDGNAGEKRQEAGWLAAAILQRAKGGILCVLGC